MGYLGKNDYQFFIQNREFMLKILTIDSELYSANKLDFPVHTYLFNNLVGMYDTDVWIRWGNGECLFNKEGKAVDFKNVINNKDSIYLNCSKEEALEKMAEVVNTPKIYKKYIPPNKIAVIRPICHTGGSGFCIKKGKLKIKDGLYATSFIRTSKEVRVWFCGQYTLMARRVTSNPSKIRAKYKCRSSWAYRFYDKVSDKLHDMTLAAAKKIGLECGAADVLYYQDKYYFLELNSAPTIDAKELISFYRDGIVKLAKQKFPDLMAKNEKV